MTRTSTRGERPWVAWVGLVVLLLRSAGSSAAAGDRHARRWLSRHRARPERIAWSIRALLTSRRLPYAHSTITAGLADTLWAHANLPDHARSNLAQALTRDLAFPSRWAADGRVSPASVSRALYEAGMNGGPVPGEATDRPHVEDTLSDREWADIATTSHVWSLIATAAATPHRVNHLAVAALGARVQRHDDDVLLAQVFAAIVPHLDEKGWALLEEPVVGSSAVIGWVVADSEQVPTRLLVRMADHPAVMVQQAVMAHPRTPDEVKVALALSLASVPSPGQ